MNKHLVNNIVKVKCYKKQTDAPAYIEAMLKYRRLPPAIRKNAATEFLKTYERPADGASMEDLTALGIIGKGLRDAYRGK